jgi:hypothetical protein
MVPADVLILRPGLFLEQEQINGSDSRWLKGGKNKNRQT